MKHRPLTREAGSGTRRGRPLSPGLSEGRILPGVVGDVLDLRQAEFLALVDVGGAGQREQN
jgi:hypothetical protein